MCRAAARVRAALPAIQDIRLVGSPANDRQRLHVPRFKRQCAVILQQRHRLGSGLACQLQVALGALVGLALGVARRLAARLLVQAQVVHGSQHADGSLEHRHRGGVDSQLVVGEPVPPRHLHVEAPLDSNGAVRCQPVGDYKALKAHRVFQIVTENRIIFARISSIHLVICTHDRPRTCLDSGLKGWVVELPSRARIHSRVHLLTVGLLLVESKVLHHCHHALALNRPNKHISEARPKVRVFA
mmetsp:Transcript_45040/g.125282  ORF Transcript_45040/g.125282 Transcript_45040/m.125282 type:complete len:243 (+) Transcript_45040:1543-2271(+)